MQAAQKLCCIGAVQHLQPAKLVDLLLDRVAARGEGKSTGQRNDGVAIAFQGEGQRSLGSFEPHFLLDEAAKFGKPYLTVIVGVSITVADPIDDELGQKTVAIVVLLLRGLRIGARGEVEDTLASQAVHRLTGLIGDLSFCGSTQEALSDGTAEAAVEYDNP